MQVDDSKTPFLKAFWIGAGGLLAYILYRGTVCSPFQLLLALMLLPAILAPSYLWCSGKARGGLPLFPILAISQLTSILLPLLIDHPVIMKYSEEQRFLGVLAVILFLVSGTVAWFLLNSRQRTPPREYLDFSDSSSTGIFLMFLGFACFVQSPLLWEVLPPLSGGMYSAIRSGSLGLAILSICCLSYRLGNGTLASSAKFAYWVLLLSFLFLNASGLILAGSMGAVLTAIATYTIARRRFPLIAVLIAFAIFSILHAGKWELRAEYWSTNRSTFREQESLFEFYARWFENGLNALGAQIDPSGTTPTRARSGVFERASILQMVLLVQSKTPDSVPYLAGETYALIPELLIPRVFLEDKVLGTEATSILSIEYGLQTRAQTRRTTIAFGVIAEAYANFGYLGVLGVGTFFGYWCAILSRWSRHLPVSSFRGLLAFLGITMAFQIEATLSIIISSYFQASLIVVGISLLFMVRKKNQDYDLMLSLEEIGHE